MDERLLKATLKVVLDGQAYLHALFQKQVAELYGHDMSEDEFEKLQDDWANETKRLIQETIPKGEE